MPCCAAEAADSAATSTSLGPDRVMLDGPVVAQDGDVIGGPLLEVMPDVEETPEVRGAQAPGEAAVVVGRWAAGAGWGGVGWGSAGTGREG